MVSHCAGGTFTVIQILEKIYKKTKGEKESATIGASVVDKQEKIRRRISFSELFS
jgi:hypothetical protein